MALGDKYATLADLKARLGISDTNDDTRLNNCLDAASRGIEGFCGRQFNDSGAVSQRLYRADGAFVAQVDDFWTTSGFTITVNNALWDSTRYELDPLNGIVDGMVGWPYMRVHAVLGSTFYPYFPGRANIQITAQWGWQTVPTPVHEACLVLAEEMFKIRDTPFGIGGYGAFGVISVKDNPFAARMLANYTRNPILAA